MMVTEKSEIVLQVGSLSTIDGQTFIILHGEKENGANPGLTDHGLTQMAALRDWLPENPTDIISGTAKRNLDSANAMKLNITAYSPIAGRPSSLEPDKKTITLADGTTLSRDMMMTTGIKEGTFELLRHCRPNTVILAGRPFLLYIGAENIESASIYVLECGTITKIATVGGNSGAGRDEV